MNDIDNQKTAEQQAFSEEIRRRLAEPGSGKPTLDEFKVMVYKDREKRRKKRNALVACIVAAFIVGYLTYDDLVPEVGADKNPKETIQTEDGVIIEDGGYGSSVGEENVFVIEEWKYISDAKTIIPNIMTPQYVPKEYEFEKLLIKRIIENDYHYKYLFVNNSRKYLKIEVVVIKGGEAAGQIYDSSRIVPFSKGEMYINEKDVKNATAFLEGGITVNIQGDISDSDMIRVLNELEH